MINRMSGKECFPLSNWVDQQIRILRWSKYLMVLATKEEDENADGSRKKQTKEKQGLLQHLFHCLRS